MAIPKEERCYRVNPFCPNCREEHLYWTIIISEEEQKKMDAYYADKAKGNQSPLAIMLEGPPLRVERTFQCPICKTEFTKSVGLFREDRIGYQSDDFIPMTWFPVHEIQE